jgi:serine/threonine protein kinase
MASMDAALKIIHSVKATAEIVCVNKNQCKRLAERFSGIGEALQDSKAEDNEDTFLEQILTVLKKGKALVETYADERNALRNVLYRADNCGAFREVHEEIDALRTCLDLDHADKSELQTPQTEKNTMLLNSDAEIDRKEMLPNMHRIILEEIPKGGGSMVERAEVDVENMEKAVTEKCYNADSSAEDLSYLNIPFSAIHLQGAIKELKPLHERPTQADAHLDGLALVMRGAWNGCDCAVKVFKSEKMHWNTAELHKEVASLVKLRHPHVTQLIGCAEHDNKTYVLYEMMDSDLRVLIESRKKKNSWSLFGNRPFSRTEEVDIITQIARGMFYLHEKGLVHGELKCTNLLVRELGDHIDVKVADFHSSRELGQAPTTKYKPAHRARWMPPEDFKYCEVGHPDLEQPTDELLMKGDVYSFAMTCYEVVTGKYPFDGVRGNDLKEKINQGLRPKLPDALSEDLKRLITKCWHEYPEQRPSFQDICYVLKVEAVNLSQVQKLLASLCFRTANEPDAESAPTRQEWSDMFKLSNLGTKSTEEIDAAAKDLPHYLKIRPSDLKPVRPLGKGASAEVYEASWIGCKFAVKWLKVEHVIKLRQEVSIMMKLLHPHVTRLVGFSVLQNRCGIVMELMKMSLRELIDVRIKGSKDPRHATPFSESEALAIIRKLALGMSFLHSQGVTHGDLKCANVLIRNEHLRSRMDVKLVDFGLSQLLGQSSPEKVSVVGRWRAPEIILSMESRDPVYIDSKAADAYSFAMMSYEVITGKIPFYEFSDAAAIAVAKGGGVPKLEGVKASRGLKQLLLSCWSLRHQDRPKFGAILEKLDHMSQSVFFL